LMTIATAKLAIQRPSQVLWPIPYSVACSILQSITRVRHITSPDYYISRSLFLLFSLP
jgi:hypothetical protein